MTFGDFIVTNDFVRVFLVDTKTDTYKTGQMGHFRYITSLKFSLSIV